MNYLPIKTQNMCCFLCIMDSSGKYLNYIYYKIHKEILLKIKYLTRKQLNYCYQMNTLTDLRLACYESPQRVISRSFSHCLPTKPFSTAVEDCLKARLKLAENRSQRNFISWSQVTLLLWPYYFHRVTV